MQLPRYQKREATKNWYGMHLAQLISSNKIFLVFFPPCTAKAENSKTTLGKVDKKVTEDKEDPKACSGRGRRQLTLKAARSGYIQPLFLKCTQELLIKFPFPAPSRNHSPMFASRQAHSKNPHRLRQDDWLLWIPHLQVSKGHETHHPSTTASSVWQTRETQEPPFQQA